MHKVHTTTHEKLMYYGMHLVVHTSPRELGKSIVFK